MTTDTSPLATGRAAECILGIIGATAGIAGAAAVWRSGPDARAWPYPAVVLAEWPILGVVALAGVALDDGKRWPRWGIITWASAGALFGSMLVGFLEFGLFALPALLALGAAATLADRRQHRPVLSHLGLAAVVAVTNLIAIALLIASTPRR